MEFSRLIDRALASAPGRKPFLVVDGRPMSYDALRDRIGRLFALFEAKGLKAGSRIGIVTHNVPDMAALLLAGLRAGLAVVNLDPELKSRERRHALEACGLGHVFIDRGLAGAESLPADLGVTVLDAEEGPSVRRLLTRVLKPEAGRARPDGLAGELADLPPRPAPDPVAEDAVGLMLFTSGTTSAPKVVCLTHRNLAAQLGTFAKVYDYDSASNILNPLPLHFTDGIMHGPMAALMAGATLFRPRKFSVQDLDDLLHGIYRDCITHFIVVPAILSMIDRLHAEFDEVFRTPDFRYVRSSGDYLPDALWRSFQSRFGVKVINTYGLSETVCEALYCGPDEERFRIGTIGKPVDCEIRIVDEAGEEVACGETGELAIRGDNIMQGYLNRPDLTAEAIKDGWFHTGDFAIKDEDGFVTIVGRKKTVVITGGANVHPQEITDVLLGYGQILEAVTFGLSDPSWGEVVASAVVPRPGAGEVVPADLIDYCRERLASYKVPRVIKVLDALPRNPAGKVLVREVAAAVESDLTVNPIRANATLEEKVLDIAARVFGCAPTDLRLSSDAESTAGWDSLAHMNLMHAVEVAFGVHLTPREIFSVSRLDHLKALILRHGGGEKRRPQ